MSEIKQELKPVEQRESKDSVKLQFLGFSVDGGSYGIDVRQVIEIITVQVITRVPNVPPVVRGVINLRGKVIPVIDPGIQFNNRPLKDAGCIIVTRLERSGGDINLGILVDVMQEVYRIGIDQMEMPDMGNGSAETGFIRNIARLDDRVLLLLDLVEMVDQLEKAITQETW